MFHDFSNHNQDVISNIILTHFHASDMAALKSTGDGDCFNAVSTNLTENENMSTELRNRICIEMALNGDKIRRNKQYPKLEIHVLSPDLKK